MIRRTCLLTGALALLAGVPSRAADPAQADAFPHFDSYIKVTGQAAAISGNDAAFQSRAKQPAKGGAGIEDLHISKDVSKSTTMVVDGRALVGSEDYLGHVNFTKNEVGSLDVGYKRFRTFYDGVGGFFPLNKQWMPLANEELSIDRGKFWAEGKLNLPNLPVFTLHYTNETRSGQKDSTIWGSSDLTGLPFNLAPNPITPNRKIAPSYIDVGERNQKIELSARHTIAKTTVELKVFAEETDNLDTRYVTNFPGEVIPWSIASLPSAAQNAAKAAVAPTNWNNQVMIAETEGFKSTISGVNFESATALNSYLTLKLGGVYELVHTEVIGSRPLVTSVPTATGVVAVTTNNYAGLTGGTRVKDFVGNVALDFKPNKNLFVKLALRGQSEYLRGSSSYNVIAASGTPAITTATTPRLGWAKLHQSVRTPVVELRFTGIKDLAVYFNGSKRNLNGDERNTSAFNPLTAVNGTLAIQHVSENHGNYTLGANWRVNARLSLRGELFRKGHKDNTVGFETRLGDYYLLDSDYTGYKLTAIAKASDLLSFTTRFISQKGEMQVTGYLPDFPAYDSLDAKNYMISESIDWTPSRFFYVQANANVIFHSISTIYPRAGVTPATSTNNAFDSNRVLQNSDNNYVTLGLLTGFAIDKDTDAQVQYNYYRADNGNAALYALTQPYGVAVKDQQVTVGVKHRFSDKWMGYAKVGYFDSANDTTGGRTNYHGPLAYVSFEHGL